MIHGLRDMILHRHFTMSVASLSSLSLKIYIRKKKTEKKVAINILASFISALKGIFKSL